MRSIRKQVLITVLVAQVALVTCLVSVILFHERNTRLRALDALLQGRSDSLAGAIQDSEDAEASVFVDPREFRPSAGDIYAVYGEAGELIGSSSSQADHLLKRTGAAGLRDGKFGSIRYRIREQPALRIIDRAETNGNGLRRAITIVYAVPKTRVRHELAESARFYVVAGLLTTSCVALLVIWSLRRSLQPISELATAAAAIQAPPHLHFSPPAAVLQVPELAVLAGSLEMVVNRLRQAFEKEQQFLSDAAHELKTAVAVVRSSAQVLLLRPREPQEYVLGLNRLIEDTSRLEDVVKQMLQLSEIAEVASRGEHCDLSRAAEEAVRQLQPFAEERMVSVLFDAQPGASAPLPESRARLLLGNLIVNAIQHSPADSQVVVNLHSLHGETKFTIRDVGAGIRPEALEHVFERFYREDASRSRNTGGTGLGLAICKAIVESARGTIAIHSELGTGTTVEVTFTSA